MANEKTPLLETIKNDVVIDIVMVEKKIMKKIVDENKTVNNKESLNYEQLLPYIIDPYWMRVRKICFSLYCITFVVILVAACISAFISASTSSCKASPLMNHSDKNFNDTNIVVAVLFPQYDHS